MEKSYQNKDNSPVVIETLREASISAPSQLAQHNFSAKQFLLLDLKTTYHSIKCDSKFCNNNNKSLPFGLKRSKNPTTLS